MLLVLLPTIGLERGKIVKETEMCFPSFCHLVDGKLKMHLQVESGILRAESLF